ncbi:MAG: hypothetical protein RLZZ507_2238 [Cyanobacteriota bacterium]|jgi:uncharacterized protein YjaZ
MGITPQRREKRQRPRRFSQTKTTEETKADAEKQAQRTAKGTAKARKQPKQQTKGRDRNLPFFLRQISDFSKIRGFIAGDRVVRTSIDETPTTTGFYS